MREIKCIVICVRLVPWVYVLFYRISVALRAKSCSLSSFSRGTTGMFAKGPDHGAEILTKGYQCSPYNVLRGKIRVMFEACAVEKTDKFIFSLERCAHDCTLHRRLHTTKQEKSSVLFVLVCVVFARKDDFIKPVSTRPTKRINGWEVRAFRSLSDK